MIGRRSAQTCISRRKPNVCKAGFARNWFSEWASTGQRDASGDHAYGRGVSGSVLLRHPRSSALLCLVASQALNQILRNLFRADPLSGIFRKAFWVDENRTVWLFFALADGLSCFLVGERIPCCAMVDDPLVSDGRFWTIGSVK